MRGRIIQSTTFWGVALALGLLLAGSLFLASPGRAAASPDPAPLLAGNDACLACHEKPGQAIQFGGDKLVISIDKTAYAASVHGAKEMACTTCHSEISGFPHPEKKVTTVRQYATQSQETCKQCHADKYKQVQNSMHQQLLASGNENAPGCSDCHNPHTQAKIMDKTTGGILPAMRVKVPETCATCHNGVYTEYENSVHGSALSGEGNPDVPTCVECHGVHNISDPRTAQFRLASPQLCAGCHTNDAIMKKYNLSTQVLNTYVADFHGTTVTLFKKQSPDHVTNKPVCFDCHGVHNISKVNDPAKGLEIKANLLVACKRCHPDATTTFPDSWLSHYIPSPTRTPLVFYVNGFYWWFMIPVVIGGMILYVLSDAVLRQIDRRKGASHK